MARTEFSRKTKREALERSGYRCEATGCDRNATVKGLCWAHYMRKRRHGDPLGGTTTPGAAQAFFDAIPEHGDGCLIWPFYRDEKGCARMVVGDGGSDYVARRLCGRTHGQRGPEFQAAHSCGNGHLGCVSPWHLSWKTRAGNLEDRIAHGTWGTKLSEDQVRSIRQEFPGKTKQELAEKYGVTRQAIHWITSRKGWTHVE